MYLRELAFDAILQHMRGESEALINSHADSSWIQDAISFNRFRDDNDGIMAEKGERERFSWVFNQEKKSPSLPLSFHKYMHIAVQYKHSKADKLGLSTCMGW